MSRSRSGATRKAAPSAAIAPAPWAITAIILAGVLVYWNSLQSPFLFDDQNSIINNAQIRRLWPLSVPLAPPRDTPVAGRPIVNLSFAINYAFDGLDLSSFHLTNVAIHILAALVLFGIVRRTLTRSGSIGPALRDAATGIAWAAALIWLLHPLQTESVNYLSERTESLMGLFYLLTLYCAIRALGRRRSARWTVAAVIACACGMASKESMVTAPLVVVLYDRIFIFESWRDGFRQRARLYVGLAGTWLVLAALLASTPRTSVGFDAGTTPTIYLLNQFQMIAQYLKLTFWPRGLVLDYGLPRPLMFSDVYLQALLVIALGLAVVAALVRWPKVGFLGAWVFITLAPTSSIVPIATEVGAERRMYLPLAGIVVLGVVAVCFAFADHKRPLRIGEGPRRTVLVALAMVVCALLAAGTFMRNREYGSRMSIARTIVERWPSGRGHYLLGTELLEAGQRDQGIMELRASAVDYPGARYALGTELLAEGMFDAAIEQLQLFITALPDHVNVAPARDMLGRAYVGKMRLDLAEEQFTRLLRDYPQYPLREQVRQMLEQIQRARAGRSG
jgi:hypothetical protein